MMSTEKCYEVLDRYEREVPRANVGLLPTTLQARKKVLDMLPHMREFVEEGRREKFMRWLGFVQGLLWYMGVYSLEELKDHNRPTEEV